MTEERESHVPLSIHPDLLVPIQLPAIREDPERPGKDS